MFLGACFPMPLATILAFHWGQMYQYKWILDIRPYNQHSYGSRVDRLTMDCPLATSGEFKAKSNRHRMLCSSNLVSLHQKAPDAASSLVPPLMHLVAPSQPP